MKTRGAAMVPGNAFEVEGVHTEWNRPQWKDPSRVVSQRGYSFSDLTSRTSEGKHLVLCDSRQEFPTRSIQSHQIQISIDPFDPNVEISNSILHYDDMQHATRYAVLRQKRRKHVILESLQQILQNMNNKTSHEAKCAGGGGGGGWRG